MSSFPKTAITASSNGLPRLYLADWASNKLSNFLRINFLEIYVGTNKEKNIDWAPAQLSQIHCQINPITNQKSKKPVQEYLSTLTNFQSTRKKLQISMRKVEGGRGYVPESVNINSIAGIGMAFRVFSKHCLL